jgi:hypothetical protein
MVSSVDSTFATVASQSPTLHDRMRAMPAARAFAVGHVV